MSLVVGDTYAYALGAAAASQQAVVSWCMSQGARSCSLVAITHNSQPSICCQHYQGRTTPALSRALLLTAAHRPGLHSRVCLQMKGSFVLQRVSDQPQASGLS